MKSILRLGLTFGTAGLMGGALGCSSHVGDQGGIDETKELVRTSTFANANGRLEVTSMTGNIDLQNPFFQNLGANGRRCDSCHKIDASMGISVAQIQAAFNATNGTDPIFRINDGSNAPKGFYSQIADVNQRRISFSMLLAHGVIRVGIGIPASRDYSLVAVNDPYMFASATELSLFRRPLPSVNVAFNSHTMWDGRESEGGRTNNLAALMNQANDATQGHAERPTPLDTATRTAIANFQLNLFAGQVQSNIAGSLTVKGCDIQQGEENPGAACEAARGGGVALQAVFTGGNDDFPGAFTKFDGTSPASATRLNDPLPLRAPNPAIAGVQLVPAATHDNISFTVVEPWESATLGANPTVNGVAQNATTTKNRGELGDGENIFYTKPIRITNVPGLNGPGDGANAGKVIQGTCTTCHSNPDVGNHSRARFFNIGIADPNPGNVGLFNMADYPQYTFRNATGSQQVTFTDPGLALRTGKFDDLGKFKVPQLRGLANRGPYFHNGAAKTLTDVVNYYNRRFNIGFTSEEIRKVVLFLQQT